MRIRLFLKLIIILVCVVLSYKYAYQPIPRIIQYVWVGGTSEPEHVKRVIATWKKHAPHYRIHKIDETNCDVSANKFVREAYRQKAWNFVADYCRFVTLEKEGGLYLDTDHKLNANPDKILHDVDRVFVWEHKGTLSASFIAVRPNDFVIKKIAQLYDSLEFNRNYFQNVYTAPVIVTDIFQKIFHVFPAIGFYEKNGTRIVPANVAMIDFGGGENVAEHLYDGFGSGNTGRTWYNYFKKLFLKDETIHLCTPTKKFFIRTTNSEGYVFKSKERADILSWGPRSVKLRWRKDKTTIQYRKKDDCYYPIK